MDLKIKITTPKGQAKKAQGKISKIILGFKKPTEVMVNKEDSEIIWVMRNLNAKQYLKITKNVGRFDFVMDRVFSSKRVKKMVNKHTDINSKNELERMLLSQTKIEIIKQQDKT